MSKPEDIQRLYAKTKQCTNAKHFSRPNEEEWKRCGFWHDSDIDRFVVENGQRAIWTPAFEQRMHAFRLQTSRQRWIESLKAKPNYKTKECRHPDRDNVILHDHETCGFSHGYDYNAEGAKRMAEENRERYQDRYQEPSADGPRIVAPFVRRALDYESEFPTLS